MPSRQPLTVRPYQLMCLLCRKGQKGDSTPYHHAGRLDELEAIIQENASVPLSLRCNVSSVYRFQNPGRDLDTPEGAAYNDLRDLTILCKMDLCPGATRPAIDLVELLVRSIPTCEGVCHYSDDNSQHWPACKFAASGHYEQAIQDHAEKTIIPYRQEAEKLAVKQQSARICATARPLKIRPHHLLCMTCFHAGRSREELAPIDEDNLHECIRAVQDDPQIPIELIQGPCMICPPCGAYESSTNLCVGGRSMGLRDEKKDLDTLRILQAEYGDILPAVELLRRLYQGIHSTAQICGHNDGKERSPIWWGCGATGNPQYVTGRETYLGLDPQLFADC